MDDLFLRLRRLVDGGAQVQAQPLASHSHHARGGRSRGGLQVLPRVPAEIDDVPLLVDDHAGRSELIDQDPLQCRAQVGLLGRQLRTVGRTPGDRGHREVDRRRDDDRPALEEAVLLVDGPEEPRLAGHVLRGTQEQETARAQGVVVEVDDLPLQLALEVDEQVPAADQVDAREGRVLRHVVAREDDQVADLLRHLELVGSPREEALQPLGRDLLGDPLRVEPRWGERERDPSTLVQTQTTEGSLGLSASGGTAGLARDLQGLLVDVGGEDLDPGRMPEACALLEHQHGDRVGLLAGRTGGNPHPHLVVGRFLGEDLGDHGPGEHLEGLGVAEEERDADQQVPEEQLDLLLVRAQPLQVLAGRGGLDHPHAPLDAPDQRALLVVGEVVPGLVLEEAHDPVQVAAGVLQEPVGTLTLLQAIEVADVIEELGGHLLDRQDVVDQPGRDGAARHAVVARGAGGLRDRETAALLDRHQAQRPVRARPREHDADPPLAPVLRQRAEEAIDRRARDLRAGIAGDQDPFLEHERSVRGHHVHVVGLDRHARPHLLHGHGRLPGEELRQDALVVRVEVRDEDEGHAAVGRHALEEALEGLETPGRGAQPDHGAERRLALLPGPPGLRLPPVHGSFLAGHTGPRRMPVPLPRARGVGDPRGRG